VKLCVVVVVLCLPAVFYTGYRLAAGSPAPTPPADELEYGIYLDGLRLVNKEREDEDCDSDDKGYLVWGDMGLLP
jgi:hypothetical protein